MVSIKRSSRSNTLCQKAMSSFWSFQYNHSIHSNSGSGLALPDDHFKLVCFMLLSHSYQGFDRSVEGCCSCKRPRVHKMPSKVALAELLQAIAGRYVTTLCVASNATLCHLHAHHAASLRNKRSLDIVVTSGILHCCLRPKLKPLTASPVNSC